jgi:hypothetical protein
MEQKTQTLNPLVLDRFCAVPMWLDDQGKIASFHEIEGWRRMDFVDSGYFWAFVDGLIISHYRFQ